MAGWHRTQGKPSSAPGTGVGIRGEQPLWHGRIHYMVCSYAVFRIISDNPSRCREAKTEPYICLNSKCHPSCVDCSYIIISGYWNTGRRPCVARIRQRHPKYLLGQPPPQTHWQARTLRRQTLGPRKRNVRYVTSTLNLLPPPHSH
jgi:hypothetical protein